MNKKHFLSCCLSLLSIACLVHKLQAQEEEKALASTVYDFIHITDTNQRENPRKESMILYMGQHSSVYKSQTLALKMEEMKKKMAEETPGVMHKNQLLFNAPNISHEELYLLPQQEKIFIGNKIGPTAYIIPENYPIINWQISTATKEIGGYICQQAKGAFGGRDYVAWFTTELPFPYGPWKLHGLPGLILQASDSKNEVVFNYAGFDKMKDNTVTISLPKDAVTTTAKNFERAKAVFEENPTASLRNNLPPNAKAKMVLKDGSGRTLSPDEFNALKASRQKQEKKHFNNPLELDKK